MEVSDSVAAKRRVEGAFFKPFLRYGPALFPVLALLWTGLLGLDFGMHWDEKYYQIRPVETIINTGIPLPRYYGYPSFDYWLSISALLPDFLVNYVAGIEPIKPALLQTLNSHAFLLRLRTLYLLIASLSSVWIYLIVMIWRKAPVEAFLASSFFALSWEVAYHSRWIATDGILMQFGTLTILLCLASYHLKRKKGIVLLAAVAAGLGFGTKYPGGLLIVPVIATIVLETIAFHPPKCVRSGRFRWPAYLLFLPDTNVARSLAITLRLCAPRVASAMLVFTLTFLATTPATIFDYTNFVAGLSYEIGHYASGHVGHTVSPGLVHGWKMLVYISSVVFSNNYLIALTIFGLSVIGFVDMLRKSGTASLVFFPFPVLYGLYFALQRAMVVRNLLVLFPFFAIASGRGATVTWSWLSDALSERRAEMRFFAKATFVGALGLFLSYNVWWLFYSAQTIRDRHTDRFLQEFVDFASGERPKQFFVSTRVRLQLIDMGALSALPITNDPKTADVVVFYANEGLEDWRRWPANQPWMTRWFGPNEVNFNIYPNWWGDDRIIVMPMSTARHLNLIILRSP